MAAINVVRRSSLRKCEYLARRRSYHAQIVAEGNGTLFEPPANGKPAIVAERFCPVDLLPESILVCNHAAAASRPKAPVPQAMS